MYTQNVNLSFQFEDYILPGVIDLLDGCDMKLANRGQPVHMSRWLASLVCTDPILLLYENK